MDHDTERVIQEIIKTKFPEYTVIAVSHRLEMIMDFDRVIVMDKGEVVEIGKPGELAATTGSRFGDFVGANKKRTHSGCRN